MPTEPNPAKGQIYPLDDHGYVTYLSQRQALLRDTLIGLAFMSGVVYVVAKWRLAKPRHGHKVDS